MSIDSMMFTPLRSSSPKVFEKLAIDDFYTSGPKIGARNRSRSITWRPLSVR